MAKFGTSSSVNFSNQAVTSTAAKTKGWMAAGYINLSATIGSKFRLGEIALTVGSEQHMGLFKGLMGTTIEQKRILDKVLDQLVLEYKPNDVAGLAMDEFGGMDDFEAPAVEDTGKEKALGYINFSLPIAGGELSKLGGISLFASNINQARVNHALSRPGTVGENNLLLVKSRLSATAFPTDLGKTMMGGNAASVEAKSFLALVI